MKRKAQINFEFLAAASLYLIALGAIIMSGSDILPRYQEEGERASLNLEARSLTNNLMTEPGSHSGGNDWENNLDQVESVGLANGFLELNRSKIQALSTVGDTSTGVLNYTRFKEITDVKRQYRFRFTRMPTIDTVNSFTRGSPPSDPDITEPDKDIYRISDNTVHYGSVDLEGYEHQFLLTSHNGAYNTTYHTTNLTDDWDFEDSAPLGEGEQVPGFDYTVESFQNRDNEPGSLLVLSRHLKTFGASIDEGSTTIKMDRYGVMENEPVRVEVWAW